MKEFWIDFSGYCEVKAQTATEAEAIFWKAISEVDTFQHNPYNDVWEIEGIEEAEENNDVY